MPNFKEIATLAALALLTSTAALAATPNAPHRHEKPSFATMDTNHDGAITLDEFKASLATHPRMLARADKMFQRLDKNHDGKIDAAEFAARHKGHHKHKGDNSQ